ncbi:hypothetical protein K431DRAFT_289645 [Polychaeton citri CBS 116435]|uniref:Uncharacterized protein n=1 Tax=Polychaeton citri CBS 116435 TaxID=1314669 RepID=A0A9P4UKQ2_9PEZI|nr:hypothetical protein K431DRAFT_289645 [Polychaeton citri CBS 116435]
MQQVRTAILRGTEVPEWLRDGGEYGEQGATRKLDALMVRTALVRAKSLAVFSTIQIASTGVEKNLVMGVIVEAQNIDSDLADWAQVYSGSMLSDADANLPSAITYTRAGILGRCCALRIINNSISIRGFDTLVHTLKQPTWCVAVLQVTRGDILETVAKELLSSISPIFDPASSACDRVVLHENGATRVELRIVPRLSRILAWSLLIAISTDYLNPDTRELLKQRLKTVADSLRDPILQSLIVEGKIHF